MQALVCNSGRTSLLLLKRLAVFRSGLICPSAHRRRRLLHSKSSDKRHKSTASELLLEQDVGMQRDRLKQLATDFAYNDHVHMKESETETNDSFTFGGPGNGKPASHRHHTHHDTHLHIHSLSHSHTHSHTTSNNPLLILSSEQFRKNPGVRITWIGLATNVGIALGKCVGGVMFHSQALLADAVHALCDMISDLLTIFSVGLAVNKPNTLYPYGYGKLETAGSLTVSSILTMAGLSIGWSSLCVVVGPIVPQVILETMASVMGHAHVAHAQPITEEVTNVNAAWIAAASIAVKEWVFRATKKIAIQTNSNVLMANAWHHRVDSLTSLVALVSITSSYIFNVQSLDAIGGLIVSVLIIKAGAEGMIDAMKEFVDQAIDHKDQRYIEVETVIKDTLSNLVSNNNSTKPYSLKELILMASGPNLRAQSVIEVPLQRWNNVLGLKEFQAVREHLRKTLQENVSNVVKLEVEFVEEQASTTKTHTNEHTH